MSETQVKSSESTSSEKAHHKPIKCVVVSDKMNKSRVAVQERLVKHGRYSKYMRRRTRYMYHDEENRSKMGDQVLIKPCKPHSANKKFTLVDIVK